MLRICSRSLMVLLALFVSSLLVACADKQNPTPAKLKYVAVPKDQVIFYKIVIPDLVDETLINSYEDYKHYRDGFRHGFMECLFKYYKQKPLQPTKIHGSLFPTGFAMGFEQASKRLGMLKQKHPRKQLRKMCYYTLLRQEYIDSKGNQIGKKFKLQNQ